jgi:hypothetical protein
MFTKTRIIGLVLGFAICVATTASAFAATANGTVSVASGGLTITTQSGSVDFGTVTLDGTDQTVAATAAPTFRVKDATGSNAGWNVTFSATNFVDGSNNIPNTSFTFNPTGGSISLVSGQAINATNGPKETGGGAVDMSAARKVVTTLANYGKGRYDYTPLAGNFSLSVPATTLIGSYASTLTATVASGP